MGFKNFKIAKHVIKEYTAIRFKMGFLPGFLVEFWMMLIILPFVFRDPLRDPFTIGRSDLDPLCGGQGVGGGMVFDPFRSHDPRNIAGIYGPGGAAGLPP